MASEKRYDIINVRPEHQIKDKLSELVELIRTDTGMRVSHGDAVLVAVVEAIKARQK